ncbi:hypothetical protein ASE17_19880 [Phenylobacterium sp. Root77]|jgi:hypothetical protein|uniref:ferritin-like domain-containing protein n=1 Tax=unclassified Phenylobacterium TaxID=2640670 RepID=UPI0006F354A2|nr:MULTISPECIES: ferritin-like protein [unclassified Phenylobacterium]KQW66974.1 hypothetical protein ASC73_17725 [Phenylobacterium sp. Root1277]KQW89667.1 hypothetical protein ASC79_18630 [Phenylobacterium sp. Root1290]KRC43464.1 hypothetical protein ASE17_19880 [Phenylobacterium sp. Root77]
MSSQSPAETEIALGGRGQLFHLLAEASEIEHTLMCSYLFAAFSLRTGAEGGLEGEQAAAVERWRGVILSVAIDEMVHLLLVANLSIAIGGRPHFGRPNFPVEAGYFPSDVVVKLTPFSPKTLDHFIFLERPRGLHLEDGEGFEPEAEYVREAGDPRLMPSHQDYATVGHLYEALRANLLRCCAHLGEEQLFIGPVSAQVGAADFDLESVNTIANLGEALRAIDTIVEQGEGSPSDREGSHYQRFIVVRQEHQALMEADPTFEPSWPVTESPVMWRPPAGDEMAYIDGRDAAPVLDLGNAVYGLLLQLVVQAFGRTGEGAGAAQRRLMAAAIDLMHVLARVAGALVRLPAGLEHEGRHAGLSFTMLRAVEPFFTGEAEDVLILERLAELRSGAERLERRVAGLAGLASAIAAVSQEYRTGRATEKGDADGTG